MSRVFAAGSERDGGSPFSDLLCLSQQTVFMVDHRKVSFLKSLDAFPKMESSLTASTGTGGLVSLVVMLLVACLLFSEIYEWRRLRYDYEFLVDHTTMKDSGMNVNIDLTIAMECKWLRIDALDAVGSSLGVDKLLTPRAVTYHNYGAEDFSSHLDAAKKAKARHDPQFDNSGWGFGSNFERKDGPLNACHVSGTFPVHKVQGSFMVTAFGHGYFGAHTPHEVMNFSHRIDELSFGKRYPGLVNPLDRTFLTAQTNFDNFQYFLGVVPTIYRDNTVTFFGGLMTTNQYAVTEFSHSVDPQKPDALPGIFFKYDLEALSVHVTQSRRGIIQFLTRTFGVIGGVFATSGVALRLYLNLQRFLFSLGASSSGYQRL